MQLPRAVAIAAAVLCLSLLLSADPAAAHNITRILAKFPDFSTFNHYLTVTHLAAEINSKQTITVCAVDNAAMSGVLAKHLPIAALKNVLSLHILLDYFGTKKLHQITNGTVLSATMYQSTGAAPGNSGFVNITDLKGGKVGFGAEDNDGTLASTYVKSLQEIPYNISVIHISHILNSPSAEAPTPSPSDQNLTALMSSHGCKIFAETLAANADASKVFSDTLAGGLTVFCPMDDVFKGFLPKFKNLTAAGKSSLLQFYGVPLYQSMAMLKSNNGDQNTLATDGSSKFDFTIQNAAAEVTLKTQLVTAKITGTLIDEEPLAIYTINKVLLPKELFKTAGAPTPAPAPAPVAEPPKKGKKKSPKKSSPPTADAVADAPAPSDDDPADSTAEKDAAVRFNGGESFVVAAAFSFCLGLFLLM